MSTGHVISSNSRFRSNPRASLPPRVFSRKAASLISSRTKPGMKGSLSHSSKSLSKKKPVSIASLGKGIVTSRRGSPVSPSASSTISGAAMVRTSPLSYMPKRPARPAICLISLPYRVLSSSPSNLVSSLKITLLIGREIPMPMASVETTTVFSPPANFRTSSRLEAGGRAP